jgi:hypothetical protein
MSYTMTVRSLVVLLAVVGPVQGAFPARAIHAPRANRHPHHYLQELHQALVDLQRAKAALGARNGTRAAQDVAVAARLVEAAARTHHTHHLSARRPGLVGAIVHAVHHHHHGHLQRTVADLRGAERQIAAGNYTVAVRDINRAEVQIREAIGFHHRYIGF